MLLRRTPPLAIAILALACEPSVPYDPATAPASVDYAGFDPKASPLPVLPLPNQLALTEPAIVTQNSTQAAVLRAFVAAGGFPNDQEVPITIPFVRYNIDPKTGAVTQTPPALDLSSINGNNLLILSTSNQGASGTVAYDPPKAGDYDQAAGILTLHKTPPCALVSPSTCTTGGKLTRRWDPGTYVVAVRGGPSGVQVTNSAAGVKPQATMYLLLSCTPTCPNGKGFIDPLNQGLIPGNNRGEKATNAALLEQLRIGYQGPFAAVDASGKFTHAEIATLSVFKIADVHAHVETDPGAGLMPIPSDFLLDANHNLIPAAQGAFGPAGPGLATLDGFSTTGPIIAQFSTAIDNSTIKDNVYIYELGETGATRLKEANEGAGAGYLAQPPGTFQTVGAATVTTALVAQPGINIPGTPLVLPPLRENTEYAVVITSGVKDFVGSSPIVRSTLGTLLMLDPALPLTSNGQSLVAGVAASDAAGLQLLRLVLHGVVLPKLTADKGISRDQVVMAYTFKTQSITGKDVYSAGPNKNSVSGAIQIAQGVPNTVAPLVCAAAGVDCSKVVPSSTTTSTTGAAIAAVFDKYGVDPAVPRSNIGAIIETQIYTFNMLDPDTGAFLRDPTKGVPEAIDVIIAVPKPNNPNLVTCSGALAALAPGNCVPLTVFQHGLSGSRTAMLLAADNLVQKGMIVVAVDAPKHGSRSFCSQVNINPATGVNVSPDLQCVPGAHCVLELPTATSDAPVKDASGTTIIASPGKCRTGTARTDPLAPFVAKPTLCISDTSSVPTAQSSCSFSTANNGIPAASGQYFISANFFRTRDTIRQHLIDITALINVIALTPTALSIAGQDVYNTLAGMGMFVIPLPATTSYVGTSLGAILGTLDVAANPRIGNAVLAVGGGTLVDTFTNAPTFKTQVDALFLSLGIDRSKIATDSSVAAKYLQTLLVAKWILDPADPLNFSANLKASPLPNLLPPLGGNTNGSVAQPAKNTFLQYANCDDTVPNPFNTAHSALIGLQPSTFALTALVPNGFAQWYSFTPAPAVTGCPGGGGMPHGFFTSWGAGQTGATQAALAGMTSQAQKRAGDFVLLPSHPAQPTRITETTPYP